MKCGECGYTGNPGEDFPSATRLMAELQDFRAGEFGPAHIEKVRKAWDSVFGDTTEWRKGSERKKGIPASGKREMAECAKGCPAG